MMVKRKFGKDEIEAQGSPDQVSAVIEKWEARVLSDASDNTERVYVIIRKNAQRRGLDGAGSRPAAELLDELLGMIP